MGQTPPTAEQGSRVKVAVTARLPDGSIALEATRESPLEFDLKPENTITGFAEALVGMKEGEKRSTTIPPHKAFGDYQPDHKLYIKRRHLSKDQNYSIGDNVTLLPQGEGGKEINGWIEKLDDREVVVNRNHRLAGKTLEIEIDLLAVS